MEDKLNFFVTIIKSTGEIIIQEGNVISIKIPKNWQKPDSNIDNPALWVSHLPSNSIGISFVSLYPSELIIKKHENTYRGKLEPNGSNDKEEFYRCDLLKEKNQEVQEQTNWGAIIFFSIVAFLVLGAITSKNI
jgi:hypothetical protein